LCLAGKRESAQQSAAAGELSAATGRAAFTTGEKERAERVEESGGAEETRGQSEGAAAGAGQREGEGARCKGKPKRFKEALEEYQSAEVTFSIHRDFQWNNNFILSYLWIFVPFCQYVTQTVEVESAATVKQLNKARQRNEVLAGRLSDQNERCRQLEEQIRKSDEYSCNLQHKIAAYEREITKLREELLKEIGHLEERKEEAVRAAASCSADHFQNLQDQFFSLQKRLTALPPTLRSMKTDYASLRSQVRNFSDFYGSAINEAKKQIAAAINEMSEANKDLLEKYRKEVALRRKYHEQLVELKGNIRVLCRVKPVLKEDQHEEGQSVVVATDPNNESSLTVISKGKGRIFELDKVFQPQATQEEIFQEIEPLVTSCIDGYHVCIFAYGQTGSGKTHTMEGTVENPGINQRALKHLFNEIEERKDMWSYTVSVSSVEIYNEVLRYFLTFVSSFLGEIPVIYTKSVPF
uniref:Si:ch211-257p13.3 n=1 Tax=Oryzias melastigma TaxID=30732 RepID=A0A3B3DL02_ORYME